MFSKSTKASIKEQFYVTIFDLVKKRREFESSVVNEILIGRLDSGLYTFADGHMYFGNHVIKIRYDLIDSVYANTYKENEIFDYYFDILPLKKGEKILMGCPYDSNTMNRFVYIVENPKNFKPDRVVILPYLHERKVYLLRYKENTEYFTTSIECGLKYTNISYGSLRPDQEGVDQANDLIVSVDLSGSKYYIFNERGLLRQMVSYKKLKLGNPIAVSPNGRNFIFLEEIGA